MFNSEFRIVVLATANTSKRWEMEALLAPLGLSLRLPSEWDAPFAPEENGDTFLDNARIKARAALALTGLPALADDSGLMVDALGGAPGVHSARFGGQGLSSEDRNTLLLRKMENEDHRAARFVCVLVCLFPDGREIIAEGICEGEILRESRGMGGFGYDPVFFVPELGRSMAELPGEEKNRISHRGKAAERLIKQWGINSR